MFASMFNATTAYQQVGINAKVASADPHQLILMLFDGALLAVSGATLNIERGDIAAKGHAISRAIDIVSNGLKISLDLEAGGDLAIRLAALYDYICSRLLHANAHNDVASLAEVSQLLGELKSAWEEIRDKTRQGTTL